MVSPFVHALGRLDSFANKARLGLLDAFHSATLRRNPLLA
jgi:hypothetical protein